MGSFFKRDRFGVDVGLIELPRVDDSRGSLSVVEGGRTIPFEIKRVYYIYELGGRSVRGAHAHRCLRQLFIAMSGSFEISLHTGTEELKYSLNDPSLGLLVPEMTWRSLNNFSSGAVCCVMASDYYLESDYIRDFDEFLGSFH